MERRTSIISPANSRNLTTLERLKLRFKKTDTTDDEYIEQLVIPPASRRADWYCNRIFVQQTYQDNFRDEHLRGWRSDINYRPGLHKIALRQAPIRNVESFKEDDIELTEGTDYELDSAAGILWRIGYCRPWRTAVVRYIAGYDPPPCEFQGGLIIEAAQVEEAVQDLALAAYAARQRDSMLKTHETPQAGSDSWWIGGLRMTPGQHGVPQGAADKLDDFKIWPGF